MWGRGVAFTPSIGDDAPACVTAISLTLKCLVSADQRNMTGTHQTAETSEPQQNFDLVNFVWDEYGQTHVVNSLLYFKEFTMKKELLSLRFGVTVESLGYGMIQVQVGPKKRHIWLSEVRYVPELKGCVFSRLNGAIWGLPTVGTTHNILSTEDNLAVVGYVDDMIASAYMLKLRVLKPSATNVVDGEGSRSEKALQDAMKNLRRQKKRKTVDPWNLRFLMILAL